jgi:hypothetical protein
MAAHDVYLNKFGAGVARGNTAASRRCVAMARIQLRLIAGPWKQASLALDGKLPDTTIAASRRRQARAYALISRRAPPPVHGPGVIGWHRPTCL